jgi:hypothetical protein
MGCSAVKKKGESMKDETKHNDLHPLAGKTVKLKSHDSNLHNKDFVIEDWWDHYFGKSWQACNGNNTCNYYAMNSTYHIPIDDQVVYGYINGTGYLVHVSEIVPVYETVKV